MSKLESLAVSIILAALVALPARAANHTQAEYQAMLGQDPPAGSNLHEEVGKYIEDFREEGWPEAAHMIYNYLQYNHQVNSQVGYDGVSNEGLNYHYLWLGGMVSAAAVLEGYTDPVGYTNPVTGKRFDTPLTHQEIIPPDNRWNSYVQNAMLSTWPDVTDSGFHDSGISNNDPLDPLDKPAWGAGTWHWAYHVKPKAVSYLLPALGQLGLGAQRIDDYDTTTQTLLHYSGKTSSAHRHSDSLMLGFFGRGRKLFSFPGHNDYTNGPHNKNMVMIGDGWQNHYVSDLHGRLECCSPMTGLQIARVDGSHIGQGGSPGGVGTTWMNRYRRTTLQNTVDLDRTYLLDVFEVDGGDVHHYMIGGAANVNQEDAASSVSTQSISNPFGTDVKGWGQLTQMRKGMFSDTDSFHVDFRFSDDTTLGSRSWIPAGEGGELYLSRLAEIWNNTDRPQYMIRRTGTAPLKSTFIALHEVLDGSGSSFISSVTRTNLSSTSVAVVVTLTDGRQDTYLVSFDGTQSMSHNGFQANALIAASSTLGSNCDLWMVEGTTASNALRTLTADFAEKTNTVSQVLRKADGDGANAFETAIVLPEGYDLAGQTLLLEALESDGSLEFTDAYTIDYVESIAGGSRIHVRHDPGVDIDPSGYIKELFWPFRGDASSIVGSKGHRHLTPAHRLRFRNSATTIPHITRIAPSEEHWQRVNGRVGRAINHGDQLSWETVPAWTPIEFEFEGANGQTGQTYETLSLAGESTVRLSTVNLGGLSEQPVIEQRFHGPQRAIQATGVTPGLRMRIYSWYGNPQWRSDETINGLSYDDVPPSKFGAQRGCRITGYIDAPSTGLYRFYARCDSSSEITIDGIVIESQQGMRGAPQWVGEIYLEQGLHELEIDHFRFTNGYSFDIRWDGPGIPYQPIPSNVLYKDITQVVDIELNYEAGTEGGSIQGVTSQTIALDAGGSPLSSPTTVTAVANSGYTFVSWNDGNTLPTRQDSQATASASYVAYFTPSNGPEFDTVLRTWRFENFGSPENSSDGSNELDPDGDGIDNLMEFALRLDPSDPDRTQIPFLVIEPSGTYFSYRKLTGNPGIDYIPEWSSNLNQWYATGFSSEVYSTSGDGLHQIIRSSMGLNNDPRHFFRLRVIESPPN